MTDFWLDSYDYEPPISRRRITVLADARCGERLDWRWIRVEPPLIVGPHRSLDQAVSLDIAAIAPRHVGATFSDGPWPLHVYVCRIKDAARQLAPEFTPDEVVIEIWATVMPVEGPPES